MKKRAMIVAAVLVLVLLSAIVAGWKWRAPVKASGGPEKVAGWIWVDSAVQSGDGVQGEDEQ